MACVLTVCNATHVIHITAGNAIQAIHYTVDNVRYVIHLTADNSRHGVCTYSWQSQACHTPYSWQQPAWCVYLTVGNARHVRHLTDDNTGHHIHLTARNIKQPYTLQFTRPNTWHTLQLPTSACHTPYSYKHQACHSPYCWQHPACHNSYSWQAHEHNRHTKCLTTDYSPCTAWALHTHHILIQSLLLMLTLQKPYSWQCSLHYSTGTWNALRLKHHTKVMIFHLQTVLEQHSLQTNIKPCTSKQRS